MVGLKNRMKDPVNKWQLIGSGLLILFFAILVLIAYIAVN